MKLWSLDARNGDHTSRLAKCGDEFALVGRVQRRAVWLSLVEKTSASKPRKSCIVAFRELTPTASES